VVIDNLKSNQILINSESAIYLIASIFIIFVKFIISH